MKKLQKFYNTNRIYVILMSIGLFCILLIIGALILYFTSQLNNNVYGNRLVGKENILISKEKENEVIKIFTDDSKVVDISIRIQGKIIYLDIILKEGTVSDAQSLAIKALEIFSDDEKEFYDISYSFAKDKSAEKDPTFPIMGYKKSNNTIISWAKTSDK